MHIDMNTEKPVAVFLFAHQDDEFGIFYEIEKSTEQQHCVMCLYLTDGSYGKASSEIRNQESCNVLINLGVKRENIHFLGSKLGIRDTKLCFSLSSAILTVAELLRNRPVASIYCPAWEGGHPDHDALCVIASVLISQYNIQAACWQYSLYNGANLRHPFFRVLCPLAENGHALSTRIPIKKRLRYLFYCATYKSQIKSWIGLLPLVAWHYLTDGNQYLQPIKPLDHCACPHAGPLYYEKRGFMAWSEFESAIRIIFPHAQK